jgi:two-component system, OmpR family, response regulator AdeR
MGRPTVLISDDEPLLVSAFAREARRSGITVVADTTSERLLELAKLIKPDLIVLDVHQKVDGRVQLARLKRDPDTRHIRVVVLSAVEDQLTRHVCLNLGAIDYEVKPMDGGFIRKVIKLVNAPTPSPEASPA